VRQRFLLKELSRYEIGTYGDIIYRNALLHPEKTAFVYGPRRVTFFQYNGRVNSLVHALRSFGLSKGDGIGLISWNCLECTDITGAAMKGGFVISPFNPRLTGNELEALINLSQVKVLFVGQEMHDLVKDLRRRLPGVEHYIALEKPVDDMAYYDDLISNFPGEEPDVQITQNDPFIIFYTSGTTGAPKGAVYTHYRKLEEARNKALQVGLQPGDTHVMVLPLFHIGGWSHFWAFYCVAGANIIMTQRSFDAKATLKALEEEKATDIHIVPTLLVTLLNQPDLDQYDLASVKRIWYAASPMPLEVLKTGIAKFGPIFAQGYGQTESGPDICILSKEAHIAAALSEEGYDILASCGQPCIGVHVRIVDDDGKDVGPGEVGEITVKSRSIMEGYWQNPAETARTIVDGWLHTGDMGQYDSHGFIYIVDRKKDMIITGGENVFPREVEEVLYRHPAVQEAAVIGVPDPVWVERVHAVIVLREGAELTAAEVTAFCKGHMAGYKTPRSVEFVDVLPRNPQGKVLKRVLKERYSGDGGKGPEPKRRGTAEGPKAGRAKGRNH
jgi:acyl-CoA synthetase (AMP-forming)/AMP-acid ligase II